MKLRLYQDTDLAGLVDVFTASVHALAEPHYAAEQRHAWAPDRPDLEAWRSRLGALHTIVAEENAAYLGFVSYESNGHIDLLYTSPRGARRGVASALLREAAAQLSSTWAVTELFTEASLVAVSFFARHGFEITEEQHVIRHGVGLKRFAMRRRGPMPQHGSAADSPSTSARPRHRD
ncbi:GNAT family N-acetyltransferase [Pseudomonas oryzae]|uniref:Acetyltransferase, GNAT family n=1 Tax=Pseudomonas oryzae TaxID=1392877 RepID=A0A1H1N3W5_9PSED|nr:GNAT family N-acetyltransferase [Pseudomonas oryzae]SDR92859.1 Acetyltransferase, GNAT family [Pseudomonas oryzae]